MVTFQRATQESLRIATMAFGIDLDTGTQWYFDESTGTWADLSTHWDTFSTSMGDGWIEHTSYRAAGPDDYWNQYATMSITWNAGCRYTP